MSEGLITEKIIELCNTIAEDSRFLSYRENILQFLENSEKYPEYFELLDYQEELEVRRDSGEEITEEDSNKLAELGQKAFSNKDIVAFMEAQEALEDMQDLVNSAVNFVLDNGRSPSVEELKEVDYAG